MGRFWVVGGEYADTRFERMAGDAAVQRFGPFATHAEALAEWQRRAWSTVDDAHARYRIEEEDEGPRPAQFWVVGCAYTDTSFRQPADPQGERRIGPFATYDEAKAEWQRQAWASVDDALSRYRIEKRSAG